MSESKCKNCQYFLQHYALGARKIFRVYCGHCIFSRAKRRRPDAEACENFLPGTDREEGFASKEYLSKELLDYVRKLELLPEIEGKG